MHNMSVSLSDYQYIYMISSMPNQTVSNNRFPTGVSDTDDDNKPLSQWSNCDAKDIIIRDLKIENREFQNKLEGRFANVILFIIVSNLFT